MSDRKLVSVEFYVEDVLKALEKYDYFLVGQLRANIKDPTITIRKDNYKVALNFEEVEQS